MNSALIKWLYLPDFFRAPNSTNLISKSNPATHPGGPAQPHPDGAEGLTLAHIKHVRECMCTQRCRPVFTGVHTGGLTVCRESHDSPCLLTHVHVYSSCRLVCPQYDTLLFLAFMCRRLLSVSPRPPQHLLPPPSASCTPYNGSPLLQVTSSCCSAPPSSGRCSRPSGRRSGSAWPASTLTTWSLCVGSPTLYPTSSTAGRSRPVCSEAPAKGPSGLTQKP